MEDELSTARHVQSSLRAGGRTRPYPAHNKPLQAHGETRIRPDQS